MTETIYCGVRFPRFDAAVLADLAAGISPSELAKKYGCSRTTIYRAKKRAVALRPYLLELRGEGTALSIGVFMARSFQVAAEEALRHFDALGGLDLPDWEIADITGDERVNVLKLKHAVKSARH